MEKLTDVQAMNLLRETIQFGALKLQGPAASNTPESGKKHAEIDAMYILTLLEKLQGK